MYITTSLALATGLGLILLLIKYATSLISRQRLMRRHPGCTTAPSIPQKFPWLGTDFLQEYNSRREMGEAVHLQEEILLTRPGRTATVRVGRQTWLFSSDPENTKAVMATEAEAMSVEPLRKGMLQGWVGDGMFASDGERWKQSRNMFKPMFSRLPVSRLDQWEKHTVNFFNTLPADDETVDLQPLLKRLYFDASMETLLGESANSQLPDQANIDAEKFEQYFESVMITSYLKTFTRTSIFPAPADKVWQEQCDYIHSIFDRYIDRALEQRRETGKASDASMLHSLIDSSQDRMFLRDQLLNVFLGAKDTAAIGIANVLFHLARHPRVYEKLRAEVAGIGDQPITFELLKSMKYLQHVIAETLRLDSPVNIGLRHVKSDCVLPRGGGTDGQSPIFVPQGTRIEISVAVLHRDPRFWGGKDAKAFRPERWGEGGGLAPKWDYAPFLGGPRMCPAQQMMLTQYAHLLVRFAQRYQRIENRDPVREYMAQVVFSQQSRNGVKVALFR